MSKKAIIIGAGPAGLTAAYELLKRTDVKPVILEKSGDIGGISKTINYKGNRMDIGGHRFFSKSDRVMKWWLNIMPLQNTNEESITINYQNKTHSIYTAPNQGTGESVNPGLVMLIRKRLSRIYFLRRFFNYPIQLSIDTLRKLGFIRTIRILFSYLFAQLAPRKPEKSLEDFIINRFGRQLYLLFFKDYTEKVWGVACNEISAEWGAQRIRGISISKAIQHAAKSLVQKKKDTGDIAQKDTETSLIEQFLYPALGPGQLWEEVAKQIEILGGTVIMHQDVTEIKIVDNEVRAVVAVNSETGEITEYEGDYFFSTMPVQELIAGMNGSVPGEVKEVAIGLQYRDFITVGVLLQRLSTTDANTGENKALDLKDTWIYIQEKDVKVGRLQLFNNWSPYMVNKEGTVWIGMEYFCNKGDDFWNLTDEEIKRTAISELEKMGLVQIDDVLDSTVHRIEKTYPAYFGTYNQFDKIKAFVDRFENLFLVGRNGMHKYNNSDHSMLTAMVAVDNISAGIITKENIWSINTEQEYHEEKNIVNEGSAAKDSVLSPAVAPHSNESFNDFLFKNGQNRKLLFWSAFLILTQLIVFKYLYPFPSFINGDSYNYLTAAYENFSINTYPTGYSTFLRLFSVFTKSDLLLVSFQYLFLQSSILALLFTIFYWYKPAKATRVILLAFLILNPVFLYLANYISSDAYFTSLSLTWFTLLLWIIHRPGLKLIVLHGLVLYLAFTVRYNALFYPIVTAIAFIYLRQNLRLKLIGIGLPILLICAFVINTGYHYKRLTGHFQLTPFSGWQLANNALYIYRYVDSADRKAVPSNLKGIDDKVRSYLNSRKDFTKYPVEAIKASTLYMWSDGLPLREYMNDQFKKDSMVSKFKRWSSMGPLYNDYGSFLIKNYPLEFLQYYIWPNTLKYYAPPLEFLSEYSTGEEQIQEVAQKWFYLGTNKVYNRVGTFEVRILDFWPIAAGIINLLFLIGLTSYWFLGGLSANNNLRQILVIVTAFWLINLSFSVFAAPITLRMQLFPITITICFSLFFLEFVIKSAFQSNDVKQLHRYPSLQG